MLEENIALLESRIRELENQDTTAPSVRLHTVTQGASSRRTPPVSPSEESGSNDTIMPDAADTSDTIMLQSVAAPPERNAQQEELSELIDAFLPHATQLGFFLHITRFINAYHARNGQLMTAICTLLTAASLWGSHFSSDPALRSREDQLLTDATQHLTDSLFVSDISLRDHTILYIIQAEVLLAQYFFFNGRNLEGRYHLSAAGALVLSCRLNLVRSDRHNLSTLNTVGLTEPEDEVQEAIPAESVWHGAEIDTPWPLSMEAYNEGGLDAVAKSHNTVQRFLGDGRIVSDPNVATLALRAQASALYARAAWLSSQHTDQVERQEALHADILAFDECITRFITALTPPSQFDPEVIASGSGSGSVDVPHTHPDLVLIRTLARVALIRLHSCLKNQDQRSRDACVAAADGAAAVVRDLDLPNLRFVDPLMAILLTTVAQVYIDEITSIQARVFLASGEPQADTTFASYSDVYLTTLATSVQRMIATLNVLGVRCPLMVAKAAEVQQALSNVL
ncbi:hypothetical protein EUX98_g8163 [Antrodiella citrinella]|uniref:Transcription factor domain-containing protein n=1 Tax=Antrodiella citrinella TaxID=2447956 RepID=A0A4S4MAR0_9APHY|nr:hypothetical protein EUX98_g8163 [Antrodiella citrinella]